MYAIRNTDTGELMSQMIGKRNRTKMKTYCRFEDPSQAWLWLHHWLVMLGEQLGGLKPDDKPTVAELRNMGFELVEWDTCPENK